MVTMANALINRNQRAAPKQLLPFCCESGWYRLRRAALYGRPARYRTSRHISSGTWPITPVSRQGKCWFWLNRRPIGNGIRDALNNRAQQHNRQWSAQSFYFEDALSEPAAAEAFSLLALLVNQEDRPSLRYWLGAGQDDCRWRSYARLRAHCEQSGQSPFAALQAMAAGAPKVLHTQTLMTRYALLVQRLTALGHLNMQQLVDSLFPAGVAEVATIRQIALLIATNVQTPSELLSELRTDIVQPELPGTQGPSIRIMSLHKSKGLTARLVVIAGCVSGILPTIKTTATAAEQARQMQEQRRLFYVGLTRSTETLVLSGAVPHAVRRRAPNECALCIRGPRGCYPAG